MTETPTNATPPPPPPPPPAAPTAAAAGGGKKGGAGKVIAGGIGAVLVGGAAVAGVVGYNTLSGGGAQPADAMPSTFQFYARVDLDPGASQKVELFKLLNKVPELKELFGIDDPNKDDIRELLFEQITQECPDIDYAADVEPWLGDRVGFGGSIKSIENEEFEFLIAVQVKDEGKAEDGVAKLFDCSDEDYGIAFYNDYVLLSENQQDVDSMLQQAKDKSLAENEEFTKATDALGEKGLASAWVDAAGLLSMFKDIPGFTDELPEEQLKQIEEAGSGAMALRVAGSAIELAGVSTGEVQTLDGRSNIADLPEDTVAAISVTGVGEVIQDQWDLFVSSLESGFYDDLGDDVGSEFDDEFGDDLSDEFGDDFGSEFDDEFTDDFSAFSVPTPEEMIQAFEDETGLTLPEDLVSLMGQTFTLAIGSANLETIPYLQGPDDLEKLDVAIHTSDGDDGNAIDVMRKLADYATQNGIPLVAQETDSGAVLATSDSAAKAIADGGGLGSSDRFASVMPFGDQATFAFYLDISTAIEKILAADPPQEIRDGVEQAKFVEAVGISAGNVDGHGKFSLRVSFAD